MFGYWQPEGLESDYTRTVLPNATRSAEAVNTVNAMTGDAGFEIGGPIHRVTRANLTNLRTTSQEYFSFFAQDTWKIGDRLDRPHHVKLYGNYAFDIGL